MNEWIPLRRSGTHLHLSYDQTFTNNLSGYNIQLREKPEFEIWLDLSPNLRKRNKQSNIYQDARELADGAIANLSLLQLDDERTLQAIAQSLLNLPNKPDTWKLTLQIERDWFFIVTPEVKSFHRTNSLFLHVQDAAGSEK